MLHYVICNWSVKKKVRNMCTSFIPACIGIWLWIIVCVFLHIHRSAVRHRFQVYSPESFLIIETSSDRILHNQAVSFILWTAVAGYMTTHSHSLQKSLHLGAHIKNLYFCLQLYVKDLKMKSVSEGNTCAKFALTLQSLFMIISYHLSLLLVK